MTRKHVRKITRSRYLYHHRPRTRRILINTVDRISTINRFTEKFYTFGFRVLNEALPQTLAGEIT